MWEPKYSNRSPKLTNYTMRSLIGVPISVLDRICQLGLEQI